ncbi:glycosyl hydrolase domain containing protein [Acanthamoeba castellanii str. Neff]|uniref:beta-glucosidase n=1 Tax=Acanthamoeba castellanii (strain ATCC 30010 / Neff) TaxID=1257118 RepID=L8HAL7_ACACF|nr:glycosyl hydrolase domain containing protein [Acanthamoeba castellanii str. Neff]ELR22292.1 glycosyl hydrolase domain containing protein [Acanthamoeba castellanii str. Neff]
MLCARRIVVLCGFALLVWAALVAAKGVDEARIRAIIANMTLLDKARQLDLYSGNDIVTTGQLDWDRIERAWSLGAGGAVHDFYPHTAKEINLLQQWAKQKSRLGIPFLFIEECLHVFPQSNAMGATWDTDLVHRVGQAIAAEARAYGIGFCLAPVLGIGYEPRWGRIEELYGEDTYHVSRLGVAMVSGLQGGTDPHTSLATNHTVVAEPKHYAGHSIPESGLNTAPAHLGPRDLETLLTLNGQVLVDTFANPNSTRNVPFTFAAGAKYAVVLEFVRPNEGSYMCLQWSLIGGTQVGQNLAVKAAAAADIIIAVVGEDTRTCGETFDRPTLDLPGSQQELLEAIRAAAPNKPFIAVLLHGRPLSVNWLNDNADAIITGFYPGQAQGQAIADVLFGDYNPAGRIPVTFPQSSGQLPMFYNYKPSARKNQTAIYADGTSSTPLYHFGHGLSYTQFAYSNLAISPIVILPSTVMTITLNVENVGKMAGEEMYVRDEVSSVTTPLRSLKGFQRVGLQPGQSTTVTFSLDVTKDLVIYNRQFKWVVEPGQFTVMVGSSSNDIRLTTTFPVLF